MVSYSVKRVKKKFEINSNGQNACFERTESCDTHTLYPDHVPCLVGVSVMYRWCIDWSCVIDGDGVVGVR